LCILHYYRLAVLGSYHGRPCDEGVGVCLFSRYPVYRAVFIRHVSRFYDKSGSVQYMQVLLMGGAGSVLSREGIYDLELMFVVYGDITLLTLLQIPQVPLATRSSRLPRLSQLLPGSSMSTKSGTELCLIDK
jgi:hypothetical protein